MASFKRFEDLPAWKAAISLAVAIFKLTARESFKFKGDLVNQCRRAALSVSNNIAEGFERGTTSELISFLYIARGSVGETRSMLRFTLELGAMPADTADIQSLIADCESISRQIRAWLDTLQNSDIKGQRHLNDDSRTAYVQRRDREAFDARMSDFRDAFERKLRGEDADEDMKKVAANFAKRKPAAAKPSASAEEPTPECPLCGNAMAKRHSKDGKEFWGCTAYPACRGTRNI